MRYLPFYSYFRRASLFLLFALFTACSEQEKEKSQPPGVQTTDNQKTEQKIKAGKGIGPVDEVELPKEVDQQMAVKGQEVFEQMCVACHKIEERYIGPAMVGVTERRKPEWILNMILNPEEMIEKDPTAKALLAEYSAPMANQNLSREQARQLLEYFRLIDASPVEKQTEE